MTGRQRRVATRDESHQVEQYGQETSQIHTQQQEQKQAWALQTQQYNIQIQQFQETKKLQQEQLDAAIAYWKQSTALQQQAMDISNKYQEDQLKLAEQQAKLQNDYAVAQEKSQAAMLMFEQTSEDLNAALNTMTNQSFTDLDNAFTTMVSDFGTGMSNMGSSMSSFFTQIAQAIHNALVTIGSSSTYSASYAASTNAGQVGTSGKPGHKASGGDFTVPPGYPNDSYNMMLTSGEHVSVTPVSLAPAGSFSAMPVGSGAQGNSQTINVYLGNKKLASYAVNAVNNDIKVS